MPVPENIRPESGALAIPDKPQPYSCEVMRQIFSVEEIELADRYQKTAADTPQQLLQWPLPHGMMQGQWRVIAMLTYNTASSENFYTEEVEQTISQDEVIAALEQLPPNEQTTRAICARRSVVAYLLCPTQEEA